MNNNCAETTVRFMRSTPEYKNIPRGTRLNNRTKSRWNKSELCEQLHIWGCGAICHWTLRDLKQSQAFRDLPASVRKRAKTKLSVCKAIARHMILVLRLSPLLDPDRALSESSIPGNMNTYCRFDRDEDKFVVKEVIFNDLNGMVAAIGDCQDNTIGCLIIITHGNRDGIQVGDTTLDKSRVHELGILPKLMRNAQVLLAACSTGETTEEELQAGELQRRRNTVRFDNTDVDNFANDLAKSIPGHDVLATPNAQRAGEWVMGRQRGNQVCGCGEDIPLPYTFIVEGQDLYIFCRDPIV
jgi:hypothetical protein